MSGDEFRREDDRLIGELTAKVEMLSTNVEALQTQMTALNNTLNTGRGVVVGAMIAAGSIGAGASALIKKLFE